MPEYINKNDIKGTGIIFTGEDDVYTSAQADGANKMWNKILSSPTVQAIPLDKVKQARESVQKYINACDETSVAGINMKSGLTFALEILDELIESEGEG